MQFFEFLIWIGQDLKYHYLNKYGSILACILLYLHPITIMYGIKYDKGYAQFKKSTSFKLLFIISFIFFLYGIYQVYFYLNKKNPEFKFLSYPDKVNCHLVWDFPDNYPSVILISLLISIYVYQENSVFWAATIMYYFLPYILIYFTNKVHKENKTKNYNGSYWCWVVAIFSFLLYYINPRIQ